MATGDIYRITPVFENADTSEVWTTHIDVRQTSAGLAPMESVGVAVKNWWNAGVGDGTALKEYYQNDVNLRQVKRRRIDPLEPVEELYTDGLPIPGTSASDPAPGQNAVVISLRTNFIGGRYRGRMFLLAPTEGAIDSGGALTAGVAEDLGEGIVGLHEELDALSLRAVVFSKKFGTNEDVTQVLTDRRIRTQRRRANEAAVYVSP